MQAFPLYPKFTFDLGLPHIYMVENSEIKLIDQEIHS